MITIQELARNVYEAGVGSDDYLNRLASDEYRTMMLNTFLDDISNISNKHSFEDLRFIREWTEPSRPEWNRVYLWKWFNSTNKHFELVDQALSLQLADGNKPTLSECVKDAIWEQSWEVFGAVTEYLTEEYHRVNALDDKE